MRKYELHFTETAYRHGRVVVEAVDAQSAIAAGKEWETSRWSEIKFSGDYDCDELFLDLVVPEAGPYDEEAPRAVWRREDPPAPVSHDALRTALDISTAHMTAQDNRALSRVATVSWSRAVFPMRLIPTDHGYIVSLYYDDETVFEESLEELRHLPTPMSEAFCAALRFARQQGVMYAWFDADGPVHPELEVFDW